MNKYKYSKGVSLIELLVVIAIIGIFVALGTQGYRSIVSNADFIANKTALTQYFNDIRYKAYADNKHYKIRMENIDNNLTVELFEPEDVNIKWRNLNLVRECNCQSGLINPDIQQNCDQSFSNVAVDSLTPIDGFTKTINNINIANCDNDACETETPDPVDVCYLFDGTTPEDLFFKVSANIAGVLSDTSFAIYKINKTGYVE